MDVKTYLRVLEAIEAAGIRAWLVGDPVREVIMGIEPVDLGVVVESCGLDALAVSLGGGTIEGDETFRMLRLSLFGSRVNIACMRGGSIEEDLALRDFSMNAIAIRSDDVFVDPWFGRHDIRNNLIRITGDDIDLVRSDPMRIVRMLRFSAELNMDIFWKSEADVQNFIRITPERIQNMPPERWGREILNGIRRCPYDFLYLCDRYHLLPFFLDDLERLKEVPAEDEAQNLFQQTMNVLRRMQDFLNGRKRRPGDVALSLAALFHRAGAEPGQIADASVAADIAVRHLKAWNMNSDIVNMVNAIIRSYNRIYEPLTEERICRSALKYGFETAEMVADFAICRAQSDSKIDMEVPIANKWKLGEVLRRFDDARRRTEGSTRYLTGDEVQKILDIRPGRVIGEILNELDMAVGTGIVSSRKEATDWVVRRGSEK
ncbi:MAG: hypothetical protein LBT15_03660 [Synergistaceae bacterium]|jgi:tRNA nucleotidyltransferase/poly(A) polymerase|nr:hypothetical protein [Synergistaceae bacterium]